jgi:hypothetical protein
MSDDGGLSTRNPVAAFRVVGIEALASLAAGAFRLTAAKTPHRARPPRAVEPTFWPGMSVASSIDRMRAALVAAIVVLTTLVAGSPSYAKSPPSAFGSDFDKGGSVKVGSDDDAPLDGTPRKSVRTAPRRVRTPKVSIRNKVQLDGSHGERRDYDEDDDDL